MKFIALDFETANSKPESVCEIGLAYVEGGKIVKSYSQLIRPGINEFNYFNTKVHGIDAMQVADQPEFDSVWKDLKDDFENCYLVAHNVAFDVGVLMAVLRQYDLPYPNLKYTCSCQIARKSFENLGSYGLANVSDHLGITLNHHHAESDAIASAQIVLKACEKKKILRFDDIESRLRLPFKTLSIHSKPGTYRKKSRRGQSVSPPTYRKGMEDPANVFYKRKVVFSGKMNSMKRAEAQKMVLEVGGYSEHFISDQTHYLVLGNQAYFDYKNGKKSAKTQTAEKLKKNGQCIHIIPEYIFLKEFE